jgi:hypothetical protein
MTIKASLDLILCFTDECKKSLHLTSANADETIFAVLATTRFQALVVPHDDDVDSTVYTFCGFDKAIEDNDERNTATRNGRPSDFDLDAELVLTSGRAGDDHLLGTLEEDEDSIVLSRHRVKQIEDCTDSSDDDSIDEFAGDETLAEYEVVMDFTSEETEEESRTLENGTSIDGNRSFPRRRTGRRHPDWQQHAATRRRDFEIHNKVVVETIDGGGLCIAL